MLKPFYVCEEHICSSVPRTNLAILANLYTNLSRRYRLNCRELLDNSIGMAPAYQTRIRDGIAIRPSRQAFNTWLQSPPIALINSRNSFPDPQLNNLDKQQSFQITNHCERCSKVETMKHLLCECEHYSECLWNPLAEILTNFSNNTSTDYVPRVELGQIIEIHNIPHPSCLLYIPDKPTRSILLSTDTRGQKRHHPQKNESTSLSAASHQYAMIGYAPRLHYSSAALILTICTLAQ